MEKYGEEGGHRLKMQENAVFAQQAAAPWAAWHHSLLLRAGAPCVPAEHNTITHLSSRGCLSFPGLWAGTKGCLTNEEFENDRSYEGWFQRALCAWLGYYVCNKVQAVIETFPAALSSLLWASWYSLTHLLSQYNLSYCEECFFSSASLTKFCKAVKADQLWDI